MVEVGRHDSPNADQQLDSRRALEAPAHLARPRPAKADRLELFLLVSFVLWVGLIAIAAALPLESALLLVLLFCGVGSVGGVLTPVAMFLFPLGPGKVASAVLFMVLFAGWLITALSVGLVLRLTLE